MPLPSKNATCERSLASARFGDDGAGVGDALTEVFERLTAQAPALFAPGAKRKSDFLRDIAGSQYRATSEVVAKEAGTRYDFLLNLFDRSIIEVENRVFADSIRRPFAGRTRARLHRDARDAGTQALAGATFAWRAVVEEGKSAQART